MFSAWFHPFSFPPPLCLLSLAIMMFSTRSLRLLSIHHFLHPDVYVLKQIVVFAFSPSNAMTSAFRFLLLLLFSSVCCHLWSNHWNRADIKLIKRCFIKRLWKTSSSYSGEVTEEQLVRSQEILFLCSPGSHSKHRCKCSVQKTSDFEEFSYAVDLFILDKLSRQPEY